MDTINENKLTNEDQQTLLLKLKKGTITLNEMDINNPNHLETSYKYFHQMPSRIATLTQTREFEFFAKALEKDYKLFVNLEKKQYSEKLCRSFLGAILKETSKTKKNIILNSYYSYEEKIVVEIFYETCKGEEVYYYDNELKVPVSLASKYKVTFRIEDSEAFIKMMDTSVQQICSPILYNFVSHMVTSCYKSALLSFLSNEDSGFYKLTNSLTTLEEAVTKQITSKFENKCAIVTSFIINNVEVDRGTRDIIEDEFFELRRKKIIIDEEINYQKESLELFTKKVEVLAKHPGIKETLTEAEKDKAFDRYLKKTYPTNDNVKRDSSSLAEREFKEINSGIDKGVDQYVVVKKRNWKVLEVLLLIAVSITFLILTFVSLYKNVIFRALIFLGIGLLADGLIILIARLIRKSNIKKAKVYEVEEMIKDGKEN